jgi:superfamily II DNA or RNA helicase
MGEHTAESSGELRREMERLRAENRRLRSLLGLDSADGATAQPAPPAAPAWEPTLFSDPAVAADPALVDGRSSPAAKIALFRSLFAGRADVYAARWEHARTGKSGWSPVVVGGPSNARRPDRAYLPLTDTTVEAHLTGRVHVGLYPLLRGDTCRLLACDFDGPSWVLDAVAYVDAAHAAGIPVALERSRSGEGAHAWMFFSGPVHASAARRIGAFLLREAMTVRAEIDLASYDRLFPAQDFMPGGSFGNLIALPLHGESRRRGTTVFLDPATLQPFEDQWAFLASLGRSSPASIESFAESVRLVAAGPDERTYRAPHGQPAPKPPETIVAEAGAMLSIDRIGLPPALLAALKHLASLHNPAYYEKERLRLSTWKTPRFLRCYGESLDRVLLPRGLREAASAVIGEAGSRLVVRDERPPLPPIDVRLEATLSPGQLDALDALSRHELGVLVAPPGAGKTVLACGVIARRAVPTLVIVDRQPLVDQWRDRLSAHLGIDRKRIGIMAAGRHRPGGVIDIAMVQSLARSDDLPELTAGYGLVVVDECHHVPATTFEGAVRQIAAPAWLGLTATPYRRDGLEGLITMYCGPVRHRMGPSALDPEAFERALVVHPTEHAVAPAGADEIDAAGPAIQAVFRGVVEDDDRTRQICADIAASARLGRNSLVLSQWTAHVERLVEGLRVLGLEPLVLQGGMGRKARGLVMDELAMLRPGGGVILIATGSFLGEGFDCPPLDTLFLTFPVAFKGRIVQYVGRVLRPVDGKVRVEVHDYVDVRVPVLGRMHARRLPAYASLGFDVRPTRSTSQSSALTSLSSLRQSR